MNYITKRIQYLAHKLTIEEALEVQQLFEEWHAVDTSEVSQKVIDEALRESITMWAMGEDAYWKLQTKLIKAGA